MRIQILVVLIALCVMSCANFRYAHKYEMGNGVYDFREEGSWYKKVIVYIKGDTVSIFRKDNPDELIIPDPLKDRIFLKKSFDMDVMTIGFKYRPGKHLPAQAIDDRF